MKKFFTILTTALLFVSGFMFSSCDEETKELLGPTNSWYKTELAYGTANLNAYIYYATSEKTAGKATLKQGLNIVLTLKDQGSESIFEELKGSAYYIQHFDDDTRTMWTSFYTSKRSKNAIQSTNQPAQLTAETPLDKIKGFNPQEWLNGILRAALGA